MVIGQDGPVIFVRHGGTCVRVHQCRIVKTNLTEESGTPVKNESVKNNVQLKLKQQMEDKGQVEDDDSSDDEDENLEQQNDGPVLGEQNNVPIVDEQNDESLNLKKGQVVKYQDIHNRENCVAKVMGRAGKATGNNRIWYNLSYLEPDSVRGAEISVDLSKVQDLKICESEDVMVLNNVSFEQAKQKELLSWKNNNVYVEKTNIGKKCISTRWICTLKDTPEGTIHKARLVARGFEEANKEDIPKDSPTCGSDSLRLVLTGMAQSTQWISKQHFFRGQKLNGRYL